jgi:hypothetical protein
VTLRQGLIAACVALALACSSKLGDPPPPVSSGALPPAPPLATGALAAGRDASSARMLPSETEEDLEPALPALPLQSDDGGTEL